MHLIPEPLSRVIVNLPLELKPLKTPSPFQTTNGWSGAYFWRWESVRGPLILKIWPEDGPTAHEHQARHHHLLSIRNFTPQIALPLADIHQNTLHPWTMSRWAELMPWIDGTPVLDSPTTTQLNEVVHALGRLHFQWESINKSFMSHSTAVSERLEKLVQLRAGRILETELPARLLQAPDFIRDRFQTIRELSRKLLDQAIASLQPLQRCQFPCQLVLRDPRPDHFLFINDKLNGIIDFGTIGMESVAVDLARLLNDWFPSNKPRFNSAIDIYRSLHSLSESEILLVHALACSGSILGGLAWIDLHFRKNRSLGREDQFVKSVDHAIDRLRGHLPHDTNLLLGT